MIIDIDDATDEKFIMNAEDEQLELYPWIILNLDEIGISIASNLFYAEYDVTQEILDEEINDYLSNVHEKILEKAIQKLEENNINVL